MMTTEEKVKKFKDLISQITAYQFINDNSVRVEWVEKVETALDIIFPRKNYKEKFALIANKKYTGTIYLCDGSYNRKGIIDHKERCFNSAIGFLHARISELQEWPEEVLVERNTKQYAVSEILQIIDRFHLITNQLRQRHDSRETLDIADEYDVQDLFHALLKLYFDDIRAEEWTPSYAGSSSRIDFFIPELDLAIEIKKTRKGLSNKEAKEQLAIDKDHYRCKENIKHLICFVYDPEGRIQNPRGFEKDLAQEGPLKTDVYVRP